MIACSTPYRSRLSHYGIVRRTLREFSLTLIIIGGQLGIYMNLLLVNWDWNNKLMLIAIALLPNWKNIITLKFPSFSKRMQLMALFFTIVILYILWNPMNDYRIRMFLFVFAMLIGLASLNIQDLRFNSIIKQVWFLSFVCAIVGYYLNQSGMMLDIMDSSNSNLAEIARLSALVVGSGCCTGIAAALCYPVKSKYMRWIIISSIVVQILVLLFIGKRTPLITGVLCIMAFLITRSRAIDIKWIGRVFVMLGILVAVFVALDSVLDLSKMGNDIWVYTISGIHDIINGTTSSGNISARYRYFYINNGLNYIIENFRWYNYLFGAGIEAAKMTDVPLLQSFVDMGLLGFLIYLYYVVILPFKSIFGKEGRSKFIMFAALLCVYSATSCMNSGYPYGLNQLKPTVFLCFALYYCRNKERIGQLGEI